MKIFLLCLLICCQVKVQATEIDTTLYSTIIGDSFAIKIILPKNYTAAKHYNTVYYLDASIKSGKALQKLLQTGNYTTLQEENIFIGIGHFGNFHTKRTRDFIPPILKNEEIKNSIFFSFLQKQLLPFIENKYSTTPKKTLIGHSYGGLFCFYCLFNATQLFTNYYALSPSTWVNKSNIFTYEKAFYNSKKNLVAALTMVNGDLEFLNFVLQSNRAMDKLLKSRNYKKLKYSYTEKHFANHNSHVKLTLLAILKAM